MTDDEDEIEFLRTMPPRPKLLAVPPWHGGSEAPTRERYTEDEFESAVANYSWHHAVKEHNAGLLRDHDEQVQAHIRDSARRDVERRSEDPNASRLADIQARLADVNAQLAAAPGDGDASEFRPLTDAEMERLRGMTVMPANAGSLSTEAYAAARDRTLKAKRLLAMEEAFAAGEKRKARR